MSAPPPRPTLLPDPRGSCGELDSVTRDILVGLSRGRTTAQVAQDLGLAPADVSRRIARLRTTWTARNRAHLVVLAVRQGLL